MTSPRPLGGGPHYGRGSPVLLHESSDPEVRAMSDDVQCVENVQSNDAVEPTRAWHRTFSGSLGLEWASHSAT